MAIRQTWGSAASLGHVVFVLTTFWRVLRQEAMRFRDLIWVGHIMENYYNITYQTQELFRSAYAYSGHVTHVMKCNDDSYVHVDKLVE